MKGFNLFFCGTFILFAALQYNDPDPYLWIPIYIYVAFICWKASKEIFYHTATLIGIGVYSIYAVYKAFDANGLIDWLKFHHAENLAGTMKAETPWVEETREFFALIILIAVLAINYFYAKKKAKSIN
jgi:hypothetical protein